MPDQRVGVIFAIIALVVGVGLKVVPIMRRGRVVVLDRPKPCSMAEAQRSLDRLVAAGFDAEIVEGADNGINMWGNVQAVGGVRPDERYVIQVPRRQAKAASRI